MNIIRQVRIEWTDDAAYDEIFGEDGPIDRFPELCQEGDDITMSDHHLAVSKRLWPMSDQNPAL